MKQINLPELPSDLRQISVFDHWQKFEVKTDADIEIAGTAIKEIKTKIKQVDEWKTRAIGPIKESVRFIEQSCKAVTDPLKTLEASLKNKVQLLWDVRQKEVQKAAEEKRLRELEEEKKKLSDAKLKYVTSDTDGGQEEALTEVMQRNKNIENLQDKDVKARQTIRTSSFTMAQQRVWKWRVTDETKIPREWLVIDEMGLNKLCRSKEVNKNELKIEGIEFYEESRAVISR